MKIRISSEVAEKIPGINIAVLVFKNIHNEKKRSDVAQLLRGLLAGKKREMKNEAKKALINEILKSTTIGNQTLAETRLLKSNLNKIAAGKDIQGGSTLNDITHYFSIKYLVPILGYDLDQVEKDLEISLIVPKQGKKAEDFEFTKDTKNVVFWLVDIGSVSKEEFEKMPDEFIKLIGKYCGAPPELKLILNVDNREDDLNYTSQKELEYVEISQHLAEEKALKEKILTTDAAPFAEESAPKGKQEPSVKERLAEAVKEATQKILEVGDSAGQSVIEEINIETPSDPEHGDYAVNVAMKLAKIMQKPPQEIAEQIIGYMPPLDYISGTKVAGPGFINFFLAEDHLKKELDQIIGLKANFGRLAIGNGKKVIVDYSSPNIAKPLGVHHLLSTIIGQTIVDLLKFVGYDVTAINYLGDWGTQYGKLIYAFKTWGSREEIEKDSLNGLLKLYVRFHEEAEKDPTLEDRGREEFKKLEEGDAESLELLNWMREISVKELERIYKILGVRFDEYLPESKYPDAAKQIIEEGVSKGIVVEGEKGALIVKFENDQYPPYILRKSDGATIYGTRDLASIKDRIERMKGDILLYVVDVAQSLHFKQLFETARKYGFTQTEFKHIVFGRMQLPEGKMSTRKGDVILLDEVFREAGERTQKLIAEKSAELSAQERDRIAQAMAVSAIKYNIISQNRETNITFDWDRMLSLEGNSGPYLEYAFARAQSILRKNREKEEATKTAALPKKEPKDKAQTDLFSMTEEAEKKEAEVTEKPPVQEETTAPFGNETEKKLLHLLVRFPEQVELAAREYKPNLLSNYLFDLARAFSAFYNEVQVLNAGTAEHKNARIKLVQATAQVLQNGLKVLGIAVFERM